MTTERFSSAAPPDSRRPSRPMFAACSTEFWQRSCTRADCRPDHHGDCRCRHRTYIRVQTFPTLYLRRRDLMRRLTHQQRRHSGPTDGPSDWERDSGLVSRKLSTGTNCGATSLQNRVVVQPDATGERGAGADPSPCTTGATGKTPAGLRSVRRPCWRGRTAAQTP